MQTQDFELIKRSFADFMKIDWFRRFKIGALCEDPISRLYSNQ